MTKTDRKDEKSGAWKAAARKPKAGLVVRRIPTTDITKGKTTPSRAMKASGREVWQIIEDGTERTVVTSASSAAAMDSAVAKYGAALKRLAKK